MKLRPAALQAGCLRLSGVLVALGQPLGGPLGEVHLPAGLGDGGVLVGLELGVVVGELIVEDGDGHPVEDDAEGDAGEGEDAAQAGLGDDVAVAHCGNTHLKRHNQKILNITQGYSVRLSTIVLV